MFDMTKIRGEEISNKSKEIAEFLLSRFEGKPVKKITIKTYFNLSHVMSGYIFAYLEMNYGFIVQSRVIIPMKKKEETKTPQ